MPRVCSGWFYETIFHSGRIASHRLIIINMRICSLLPGATEIAFALGLGDQLVGVTHECDYPAEAKQKPVVVRSAIDTYRLSGQEIDRKVSELLKAGKGLYQIDDEAFAKSAPDLILTQGLCDVC